MFTRPNRHFESVKNEIIENQFVYFLLAVILLLAFFVRIYRVEALLGFYYDQGRDALVIWKFWHERDPFLIGPVTGLAGIFLGPFYYYLIAPFYLIGGGNPVAPSIFLAFLSVAAIFTLYYLGWKFHSRATGIIAAAIAAFSYYIVLTGRWLSNPNPMQILSLFLLYAMYKVATHHDRHWWAAIFLTIGISLHYEAASAVFYIPMIFVFAVWNRHHLPNLKTTLISGGLFLLTILPQIIFNFLHDNILIDNFRRIIFEEKSFQSDFLTVITARKAYFKEVFFSKILPGQYTFASFLTFLSAVAILGKKVEFLRSKALSTLIIYIGVPMLGFIAFQGNSGNIYDYYMAGYYLPMILLFSLGLGVLWRDTAGKVSVMIFFAIFLFINISLLLDYYKKDLTNPNHVALGYELNAVDWIFNDAKERGKFNIDVYVPPVIPHSYDYLFLWRGTKRCGKELCGLKLKEQVPVLYTLYEVDPPHPERLDAWLAKQTGIGMVEDEMRYGGIVVQRRLRY